MNVEQEESEPQSNLSSRLYILITCLAQYCSSRKTVTVLVLLIFLEMTLLLASTAAYKSQETNRNISFREAFIAHGLPESLNQTLELARYLSSHLVQQQSTAETEDDWTKFAEYYNNDNSNKK